LYFVFEFIKNDRRIDVIINILYKSI